MCLPRLGMMCLAGRLFESACKMMGLSKFGRCHLVYLTVKAPLIEVRWGMRGRPTLRL
ncbi:hypothetical protein BJV77DRAFT_976287 [Russula vinacea]|nr:hypothetical protein BJV77DRAFT_976287 [Russula vinacea]